MDLPKHCNRCGAEIRLPNNILKTPSITYFLGNAGASAETVYLCPACRKGFIEWFISYSFEED